MTPDKDRSGSCLCGAVRIRAVVHDPDAVSACHCATCRTWGGGPLFSVECEGKVEIEGEEDVTVFASSDWAERGFCRRCGTHLFYRLRNHDMFDIPVGLFGDRSGWSLGEQIFVDEQPDFYALANETPRLTGPEAFKKYFESL